MKKRLIQIGKILLYVHVVLAIGLVLTHCSVKRYARKANERAMQEVPFDVVIVPGVPFEHDNTTSVMKIRLYWAKLLYDSGYTKNIIFSGSAVYSPYVESVVMKVMADSLGIPSDHTFSEKRAEHSTENVYYGWKMAHEMGFKKIALATDPYQSRLLKSFMNRYCPDMLAMPIIFGRLDIDTKELPAIDSTAAYVHDFVSIKDREGFWQRFQGTLGRRVKEEIKNQNR